MKNKVSMYMVRLGVMLIGFSGLALVARPSPLPGTDWVIPSILPHLAGYAVFVAGLVAVIMSWFPRWSCKVEDFLERTPHTRRDAIAKYVLMVLTAVVFLAGWLRAVGGAIGSESGGSLTGYIVFFAGLAVLVFLLVLILAGRWLIRWR